MRSLIHWRMPLAMLLAGVGLVSPVAAQQSGLASPAGLWAAQTSARTITLVWKGVAGAVGYLVFGPKALKGELRPEIQPLAQLGGNAVRFVAQVITPGVAHLYSIQALGPKGAVSEKAVFNPVVAVAKQAVTTVAPPATLTAQTTGSHQIALRWDSVPGATAYTIGRSVRPEGFRTLCELCPPAEYVDTNPVAGAAHLYSVVAVTPGGTSRATRSNEITPLGEKGGIATDPSPKGLSDLKATVVSPTSVRLTWVPGLAASVFRVKRKAGMTQAQVIATLSGAASSFLDYLAGGLAGGISYEVEALNAKGSIGKAAVTVAPQAGGTDSVAASPKGLSGLKATVLSPTSVQLTWNPGIGVSSFQIKRKAGTMQPQVVASLSGAASSFIDHLAGGLFGGVMYEVEAIDAKGSMAKTAVAVGPDKARTDTAVSDSGAVGPSPRTAPPGVTLARAVVTPAKAVVLSWQASPGATAYRLERSLGGGPFEPLADLGGGEARYTDTTPDLLEQDPAYRIISVTPDGSSTPVPFNRIVLDRDLGEPKANAP